MGEFARQRGIKISELPAPDILAELYREQFSHIRHLERVDITTFIFVVIALTTLFVVAQLPIIHQDPYDRLAVAIAQLLLLLGGTHIHGNMAQSVWIRFAVIGQIEKALGLVSTGIIPSTLGLAVPTSFVGFVCRLFLSYRGAMIVVYFGLTWVSAFLILYKTTQAPLVPLLAMLLSVALALGSFTTNYARLARHMAALILEIELGRVPCKSLPEQYCELAEALLLLHPPPLNESLAHFQKALELEPGNARARDGVDSIMSWRVQDFR